MLLSAADLFYVNIRNWLQAGSPGNHISVPGRENFLFSQVSTLDLRSMYPHI